MNKKTENIIIVAAILIAMLFVIYKAAPLLVAGSYPYAETYELNVPEANVIRTINLFKKEHPELVPPKVQIQNSGQFDLVDGRRDSSDLWYSFYFYYPKENQIIQTWTRSAGMQATTFAFVSINSGLNIGNWKDVNKDFGTAENKKIKQEFEERILDSIKQRLRTQK